MVIEIRDGNCLLAMILSHRHSKPGIEFFTSSDEGLQMGYMQHPVGKRIQPHVHNLAPRNVPSTQEALFIRKGKLRADFYSLEKKFIETQILEAGDVILLLQGGHGFEVLEELEMIEVKQGPYVGEHDKTRFDAPAN